MSFLNNIFKTNKSKSVNKMNVKPNTRQLKEEEHLIITASEEKQFIIELKNNKI